MRYRYEDYPVDLLRALLTYQELVKLFLQLVLQTGGDIEEALKWMKYLQERGIIDDSIDLEQFRNELEKNEIIEDRDGKLALSAGGERRIRRSALEEIFSWLSNGRDADDIRLTQEDFEVHEEEHLTSCATVLAIDISHSMILYGEDRFTPAKKVALAMVELIQSKYPKDSIDVLLFGDDAKRVPISEISKTQVGPFHTNTKAGLAMARKILQHRKNPNKQIFLITDGKPSAIWERGRLYKNPFGLDLKIVNRTLEEADACRRDGITITTFMIATDSYLVDFIDKLTKINRGRAYYASPYNLAEFLFTDYIRNRKKFLH